MGEKGQNLVEFSVIIALVGLFSLLVWTMLGDTVTQLFRNSSIQIAGYKPFGGTASVGFGSNITGGALGGTPKAPVQVCDSGSCTIDFGSYILTGVPENMQDLVKASGASGGMKNVMSLMNQIADQLEKEGDVAGAKDFRDMANLCHYWSDITNKFEVYSSLNDDPDKVYDLIKSEKYDVPSEIEHLISKPELGANSFFLDIYTPGWARYLQMHDPVKYNTYKQYTPSYQVLELYDKIQSDTKYSPEIKGVTTELFLMVSDLTNSQMVHYSSMDSYYANNGKGSIQIGDPLTGKSLKSPTNTNIDSLLDEIVNTKISVGQHFNSALICAAGNNTDVQNKCHK